MVEDLCIISGCILSGKCAVKPGPADIHIDSYRQTYSLHKTSECITDRGRFCQSYYGFVTVSHIFC